MMERRNFRTLWTGRKRESDVFVDCKLFKENFTIVICDFILTILFKLRDEI